MSDLQKMLKDEGYVGVRQMKNGEWIGILPMNYTFGLHVGINEYGYRGRYCYESSIQAIIAAKEYEGEGDPLGPWIKYKGEGGERMGPGAKDEGGYIDMVAVLLTLVAILLLGVFYVAGYDFGKRNLVIDIDSYGCEKVITAYHGIEKK